jgi:metallopeptidase MepB
MFHTVFEGNLMDCKEGMRYRRTLLEKGGSQDEIATLTSFLGRKPSTQAFHTELSLT